MRNSLPVSNNFLQVSNEDNLSRCNSTAKLVPGTPKANASRQNSMEEGQLYAYENTLQLDDEERRDAIV